MKTLLRFLFLVILLVSLAILSILYNDNRHSFAYNRKESSDNPPTENLPIQDNYRSRNLLEELSESDNASKTLDIIKTLISMDKASEYEFKKNMTHKMSLLSHQLEDVEHYLKTLSKTDVNCDNIGETCFSGSKYLPIDVIYTWVNGSDPWWLESLARFKKEINSKDLVATNIGAHRSSDNGELRHSLRSLVRFAPWVRHIYLLTNGQIPSWLNIHHKRITVVSHAEVFKDKTHLPTFNSFAIETHMHRIKDLSDHFIYMNDDYFLGKPIEPEDFVTSQGYKVFWGKTCNKEFENGGLEAPKRRLMSDDKFLDSLNFVRKLYDQEFGKVKKGMTRYEPPHMPFMMNKTIIEALHKRFSKEFLKTSSNRLRSSDDMETALAYYYFVIHAVHNPTKVEFLQEVDFNKDGIISKVELELLATRLYNLPLKSSDRTAFDQIVKNCLDSNKINNFTSQNIQKCTSLMPLVEKAIEKTFINDYDHEMIDRSELTFRMLKGDLAKVRAEMDYVRRTVTKFVCLNDDLSHKGTAEDDSIAQEYENFHHSFFPDPSPFELPFGSENIFLHI